ncbi:MULTISPECIES: hypothetical protein [Streptomyces]|uniref:Secreted protein n=1 Tax=Streptomyces dengpaensis TaxID=2049881 RepID=A0ABM6SVQ7_9ACTN|nr:MULTISPECIES: hypothetical protein [Streptomyces]AVH58859.1 hypothetical protein C4B68_27310 [Streptomyces dengpaensis]PIB11090.1 hypothetical protein B1C81_04340 [Streptomyces sp. HG99]
MTDGAVWVAVFTGATAVLASWVTTLGNARAAKVQAEASAWAQQRDRIRELRRAAYLDLMEQAHITGELYWRVGDAYAQLSAPDGRLARIQELRVELRTAFDPLMRCVRVVLLEGPAPAAEAAVAVQGAALEANRALWRITEGDSGARERFDEAHGVFRRRLERFVEAARNAMTAS